jgi:predicted transcriptional regulator
MNDEREREKDLETRVIAELRQQPLYALELATALTEDKREIARALVRLGSAGVVCVPKRNVRFQLA